MGPEQVPSDLFSTTLRSATRKQPVRGVRANIEPLKCSCLLAGILFSVDVYHSKIRASMQSEPHYMLTYVFDL